ncbi:MAG: starch-binding protein [Clostridium sp.]|nr:starch-binding protein [Clostridium sp.]
MIRLKRNIISLIITITMSSGMLLVNPINTSASVNPEMQLNNKRNEQGLAEKINDGTILHAFSWSFNTIKDRMAEIADSGYSSIQVSPISACVKNSDRTHTWEWENTYQPTGYTIGNYIVGTKDEFVSMCKEAKKYGIKIVVDIVSNHLAVDWSQISPELRNNPSLFHNKGGIYNDWGSRESVTQKDLLGLHDLNTQNPEVQNKVINFMKECVDAGADGFRFDTTKHIELPDDGSFGSNFWPNVLGAIRDYKPDIFLYGEVLQDYNNPHVSRYSAYGKYMGLTADYYGDEVRNEVNSKNLCNLVDYKSEGVSPDRLVTYSETHDTYANGGSKSSGDSEWTIRKGYEIVTARSQGTPLFLARPKSTGRNWEGKLEGPVGVPQNDWNNAEVREVNKFHNAMIGEGEYIRYLNNRTVAIERGNKGEVIINLDGGYNGSIPTNLANGEYVDQMTGNKVNVFNGQMNIDVKSGMTAVIYNYKPIITSSVSAMPGSKNYSSDKIDITLSAKNVGNARYAIDGVDMGSYTDGDKISIGADKKVNEKSILTLTAIDKDGKQLKETYTYTKVEKSSNIAYIELPSGWGEPYAYVYDASTGKVQTNAAWPGVKMTKVRDNLYSYEVDSQMEKPKVIFTDNVRQYPSQGQAGLDLNGSMIYKNNAWQPYNNENPGEKEYPKLSGTNVAVIELPSGWGEPYAYVYDASTGKVQMNAAWPGVKMTKVGDNLYAYEVPAEYKNPKVIFTDKKTQYPSSGQPGLDVKGQMLYNGSTWTKYVATEKEDPIKTKSVYINLPAGWSEPYAYVYEELTMKVKSNAVWPGVKMTKVVDGIYKYEIPEDFSAPKVIFTDGKNQYPSSEGLSVTDNMIYSNGNWSKYTK